MPAHGLPAQTDAGISSGTSAHGLPAQTDAEISFGKPVHGLPAFTDGSIHRQPGPARLLCPPLAIISAAHMSTGAEIAFGTPVHGRPASTDADFSERQRTACPLEIKQLLLLREPIPRGGPISTHSATPKSLAPPLVLLECGNFFKVSNRHRGPSRIFKFWLVAHHGTAKFRRTGSKPFSLHDS